MSMSSWRASDELAAQRLEHSIGRKVTQEPFEILDVTQGA